MPRLFIDDSRRKALCTWKHAFRIVLRFVLLALKKRNCECFMIPLQCSYGHSRKLGLLVIYFHICSLRYLSLYCWESEAKRRAASIDFSGAFLIGQITLSSNLAFRLRNCEGNCCKSCVCNRLCKSLHFTSTSPHTVCTTYLSEHSV